MYAFENIIEKHGYSEEFGIYLKPIYEALVAYYQDESIVYNALLDAKIDTVDNVYDYLKNHDLLESDDTLVSEGDLKRCSGVYQSVPELTFENGSYQIKGARRIVLITDLNPEHKTGTLIHELCHLIKSYHNEYEIDGDTLISYNGLIERYYKLETENGKVKKTLIKEIGLGLEEGLTSVSEGDISRKVINPEYKQSGYGAVNAIARNFIADSNIFETVKEAELYHDKSPLYDIFGDSYPKLEDISDRSYKLTLDMFASIFDREKMDELSEELNDLLSTKYQTIRQEMATRVDDNFTK